MPRSPATKQQPPNRYRQTNRQRARGWLREQSKCDQQNKSARHPQLLHEIGVRLGKEVPGLSIHLACATGFAARRERSTASATSIAEISARLGSSCEPRL